jgi:multidrug efflux pump subunit AcrA (membrane-fusion protein)
MKSKKIVILLIVLVIVGLSGLYYFKKQSISSAETSADTQATFTIKQMPLSETYTTTGTVIAENDQTITVGFSSKVLEIYVEPGQEIKAGEPILLLDDTDLNYDIKNAAYEIETLKSSIASASQTGATSLENALSDAKANLATAEKNYQNNLVLLDTGAITENDFETYTLNLKSAQNKVVEAENSLNSYYAKNEISLSKTKLELLELNLENLEADLDNILIVAPFDGTIADLYYTVGENVTEDSSLVRVTDLSHLQVASTISEYDISKFKKGMSATISTLSNKTIGYDAIITEIGIIGSISGSEVSIPMTFTLDDKQTVESLYPNFTATVDVLISESPSALVVPFEAVTKDANSQSYILKQTTDGIVPVMVTTGITNEIYVEVISDDLSPGDTIVYQTSSASSEALMQNTGLFGIGGNAINGGGALPPNMGERPSGNGRKTNN